jgi:general secretion pathway protein D
MIAKRTNAIPERSGLVGGFIRPGFVGRHQLYRAVLALIVAATTAEIAAAGEAAPALDPPSPTAAELIALDFQDIELPALIKFISAVTKRSFVFDDRVRGKVSIVAPEKMSVQQAYAAFQSALLLAGFTTVTSGAITKIVPLEEAKTSAIETIVPGNVAAHSDEIVTELVPLESIPAADALPIVQRLVSEKGVVAAYAGNNALVIVDTASNLRRIRRILNELDVHTTSRQLIVLRLKNASATELTAMLQQLLRE